MERGIAAFGTAVAVGLAGCSEQAATGTPGKQPGSSYNAPAWPTDRGGPRHTASVGGNLSLPLSERWSRSLGSEITGSPVGGHESVLVGTVDGELYALDPNDGGTKWTCDAGVEIDPPRPPSARTGARTGTSG